jgi:hypothetical protein
LFPKQEIPSLHISFPTQIDQERGQFFLVVPFSLLPKEKKEKKNSRNRKMGAWEVDTQILYTFHDLPTNHGIPPTGAMQFVSKGGQKQKPKEKRKRKMAVWA